MVRAPESCDQRMHSAASYELKKGPWTTEEDQKLVAYIQTHGHGSWRTLPKQAGLARCGKSCRLRWSNYLRPGIKRGSFSPQEDDSIIQLHALLGNRWSTIATHLPGRTDNEIKNHWNTKLRKRLLKMGLDPTTHRPCLQPSIGAQMPSMNTMLLSLLQQQTPKLADLGNHMDTSSLLKYLLLQGSTGSSFPNHTNTPGSTPPSMPNLSSSIASTFPTFDPTLLNAAQSYLMLEYLKLGSSNDGNLQTSNLDYQLNQVITQLVLVKLLQQQGSSSSFTSTSSAYPRFDSKLPAQSLMDGGQQAPIQLSMDLPTYGQGIQSKPVALGTHLPHESTRNEEKTSYGNSFSSLNCVEKLQNGLPPNILTSMNNSAFQQRLLQAFPFLAESLVEPSRSSAMDDVGSHQIPQPTHLSISPSLLSANIPLFNQKPISWNTNEVVRQSPAFDVPLGNGTHMNLMTTWDGPSISGVDGSKDVASSSTAMNTSSSSTISSASTPITTFVHPSTPSTNNINYVQDYWSSLLNLFSPSAPHQ